MKVGEVSAPIDRIDRICKRVNGFCIGVGILDSGANCDPIHFFFNVKDRMEYIPVAVEITHERSNPTLEVKSHLSVDAPVQEIDCHSAGDESHFPKTLHQAIEPEIHLPFKNLGVELESSPGSSGLGIRFANH